MLLFVVSTKDGWVDIMRRGIDARGVDLDVSQTEYTVASSHTSESTKDLLSNQH